jgi:hypothetical protein
MMTTSNGRRRTSKATGQAQHEPVQDSAGPDTDAGPAPKPAKVSLDLDLLEAEGHQVEPFTVRVGGQEFTFHNPREIDWQDILLAMRNPLMFVKYALGEEQYAPFLAQRIPEWKMERLVSEFFKHYGMPSLPELSALPG